MWMVAAIAFMPLAAVTFGLLSLVVVIFPEAMRDLPLGATLLYGAAALSVVISVPLSFLVARRMVTARDRRMLRG